MPSSLPSWLLPAGLAAGVVALMLATRKAGPTAVAPRVFSNIGEGRGSGGMRDAMQVGDVIHILPSEVMPGLTPLPQYLVVAKVLSIAPNTVRGEVAQVGPNLRDLKPVAPSTHDFSKDDVITIIRDGREIA